MIINKKKHLIDISNYNELKQSLFSKINEKDILIIDNKLKSNPFIKIIIKKFKSRCLFIKGHEKIKTLNKYCLIIEAILKMGIQRKSKLISIGGGTIGDFSGFVASSLLRGIDHYLVPTSLLAMVDSSIGGKTGVNSIYGKNLIGSFYIPKKVYIVPEFLNSLPKRELSCGFAEVIKYSFIRPSFFKNDLLSLNEQNKEELLNIIKFSIETKLKFIGDFREQSNSRSARAILNFGHTIGHAIENSNTYDSNIKHGEAIALGMIIELKISILLGYYKNSLDIMIELLKKFNLPLSYEKFITTTNISRLITKIKFDKKVSDKNINLICIDNKGGFIKKVSFKKLETILNKLN